MRYVTFIIIDRGLTMNKKLVENHEQLVISLQSSVVELGYHTLKITSPDEVDVIYETLNYLQRFKKTAYACPIDLPHAQQLENIYDSLISSQDPIIELEDYDIVVLEKELLSLGLERACNKLTQTAVCQITYI